MDLLQDESVHRIRLVRQGTLNRTWHDVNTHAVGTFIIPLGVFQASLGPLELI